MTENKAIISFDIMKCALLAGTQPNIEPNKENLALVDLAIMALEEVQQYRAIGTPEECRKSVEICKAMIERGIEPEDVENYIALEDELVKKGYTIGELMQAKKRETAMKPICPVCGENVRGLGKQWGNWCSHCGQKLDWGDEE